MWYNLFATGCCKAMHITKEHGISFCNFVSYYMCGRFLYHYPQHTHTLCVCARLYSIEELSVFVP